MKAGPYSTTHHNDTCRHRLDNIADLHHPVEIKRGHTREIVCAEDLAVWPCPTDRALMGETP